MAAYEGTTKITLDVERDELHAYDISSDPGEMHNIWSSEAEGSRSLADAARDAARRMQGTHAPTISDETEERLRAWGYL